MCASLLEIYLEVEFLCHRLHLDSILKVNSKGFPEVVVPIYGPTASSIGEFLLLYFIPKAWDSQPS